MDHELQMILTKLHTIIKKEQRLSRKHFEKLMARSDIPTRLKRKIKAYHERSQTTKSGGCGTNKGNGDYLSGSITLEGHEKEITLTHGLGQGSSGAVYALEGNEVIKIVQKYVTGFIKIYHILPTHVIELLTLPPSLNSMAQRNMFLTLQKHLHLHPHHLRVLH